MLPASLTVHRQLPLPHGNRGWQIGNEHDHRAPASCWFCVLCDLACGPEPARVLPCKWNIGLRDFRDLVAWQLSYTLKCEVFEFTTKPAAARDVRYCDEIRDSSASTPRNIAEGFGRYRPAEFARFLEFALGSLVETRNSLIDGRDRGYLEAKLFSRLWNLSGAAERATKNLMLSKTRQVARSAKSHALSAAASTVGKGVPARSS